MGRSGVERGHQSRFQVVAVSVKVIDRLIGSPGWPHALAKFDILALGWTIPRPPEK